MAIKVLVFGQISDCISQKDLVISTVKDTDELNSQLIHLYPCLANINYTMAINKKVIAETTPLNDQDEVALLPAFSGG